MKFAGIFPALTTPFNAAGDLYEAKVTANIERYNSVALAGYVATGTTGESGLLSKEEKVRTWELVAQSAAPGRVLIAGAGQESVRDTVMLANVAATLGYHAVLVRTPQYFRNQMSQAATQLLYYRSVADQAKLPLVLYNFPQATGIDLAPATVASLAEHPNIVGIKESSGSLERILELVRLCPAGFHVMSGNTPTLFASLQAGATGGILAFAAAAPYAAVTIWEAFRSRDYEAAQDWQRRVVPAAQAVTSKYGVAGLKFAMEQMGLYGGAPRLPLLPPAESAREEITHAFRELRG